MLNRGVTLAITGRSKEKLEGVAEECRAKGAVVITGLFDITDATAVTQFLRTVDDRTPVDLLIANAAVSAGGSYVKIVSLNYQVLWRKQVL